MQVEPKVSGQREKHVIFITPATAQTLKELADAHESIPARVIEAMVSTYGPALLKEAKK